jgi:hypothetical protein
MRPDLAAAGVEVGDEGIDVAAFDDGADPVLEAVAQQFRQGERAVLAIEKDLAVDGIGVLQPILRIEQPYGLSAVRLRPHQRGQPTVHRRLEIVVGFHAQLGDDDRTELRRRPESGLPNPRPPA